MAHLPTESLGLLIGPYHWALHWGKIAESTDLLYTGVQKCLTVNYIKQGNQLTLQSYCISSVKDFNFLLSSSFTLDVGIVYYRGNKRTFKVWSTKLSLNRGSNLHPLTGAPKQRAPIKLFDQASAPTGDPPATGVPPTQWPPRNRILQQSIPTAESFQHSAPIFKLQSQVHV